MKIVYLAPIPYDGLRQRPQFLAEGLAREHEVIYVEPTVSMLKSLLKGGLNYRGFSQKVNSGLTICRLNGTWLLPRFLEGVWSGFGMPERLALRTLLKDADAVWVGFAPWFDLLRDFPGRIIYDRMDDNAQLTDNPLMRRLIQRTEPQLLRRADLLLVTARAFYDEAAAMGLAPVLVPNAVDAAQAERVWTPALPAESGVRTFGYVGMLAHWFDLDAIRAILDAAPENRVVLVGPEEIDRLEDPRVRYVGPVPKEQVGAWIASFDVCLYPFRPSPLLDTINPVKIYEYLAQNKPVLAVRSRETAAFGELVHTYDGVEKLRVLASSTWKVPFPSEDARKKFAAANDWDSRTANVLDLIRNWVT